MNNKELKKLIDIAAGRKKADTVIKNCKVVDVYSGKIIEGDIALSDNKIAGIGSYEGLTEYDANGQYASPGFIDSHIHIESAYVSPEELGNLLVPHGGTTIIADPHELVNVCGLEGLNYMRSAAKNTKMSIKFMVPSCVPATPFEHAGATIAASDMESPIKYDDVLGLGEFMDFPGVISGNEAVLDKLLVAINEGKLIDGHSPSLLSKDLNAYAAGLIRTDHECSTVEEMHNRIERGLYILLRQGSACHDLVPLLKGVTEENSRRCLLCSDDRQPKTILETGHLDDHLRICVNHGINPITAIRMATLNAAECFRLYDRGAIAPGLRGDIVLFDNLTDFNISKVFIEGELVGENGNYLPKFETYPIDKVQGGFKVKDFSKEKLNIKLRGKKAHIIDILPGGVLTAKSIAEVNLNENNEFVYSPEDGIVKVAVVERHQNTGNVATALLRNYGIKHGAIALSIAHDSHNIITVGVNDDDMTLAVNELIAQHGGVVLVKDGKMVETMPMPIGGIMSDKSGQWVNDKLTAIHEAAYKELGISGDVEPVMTLCFMSLAVIPEIKLTDKGLFDVMKFDFIDLDAE
ncbi:MAG: adenine deaminase [Clostridium sp.]|uniref:adenine deaminase n=1 Tax=Clostridium sp. TaxID=1506 RepID=UPI002FC917BE